MLAEEGEIFAHAQGDASPLNESFESAMGTLGLSERKPVPGPIAFEESDPLGVRLMATVHSSLASATGLSQSLFTYIYTYMRNV